MSEYFGSIEPASRRNRTMFTEKADHLHGMGATSLLDRYNMVMHNLCCVNHTMEVDNHGELSRNSKAA